MKVEKIEVSNMGNALRGMRNPKKSWNKSDSISALINLNNDNSDLIVTDYWMNSLGYKKDNQKMYKKINQSLIKNGTLQLSPFTQTANVCFIGPKDMKLAQSLIKAGPEHRKFMRQIFVSMDLTAPVFLWKEINTYKIFTTENSTSTMHTIKNENIDLKRFETDDYEPSLLIDDVTVGEKINDFIEFLEKVRKTYLETGDERYWKELIRWCPSSWLQTRTFTFNYENAYNMIKQRENHKLSEWHWIINKALMKLPYADQFFKLKNII